MSLSKNPYLVVSESNHKFQEMRDFQNNETIIRNASSSHLPCSLQYDSNISHSRAKLFNEMIKEKHDAIKNEITNLLLNFRGIPVIELDEIQENEFRNQHGWCSVWIKYFDLYPNIGKRIPSLQEIVRCFDNDITIFKVSIFYPGVNLRVHTGPSMGILRYHYGISIPTGDCFLEIEGTKIKWEEGKGILFDDTLEHRACNNTQDARVCIFGDFYREFPTDLDIENRRLLLYFGNSKLANSTKNFIS